MTEISSGPKPEHLGPGSVLGHFELSEMIGAGGMGQVYKARDIRLDRTVALKILSPELFLSDKAKLRFVREARFAAAISHENVATIHEIDEREGISFIAMELVPGTTLKQLLAAGPLPLQQIISMGRQVCRALEVAHRHGVIHRDIKSSNIMIAPDGRVKVLDFGLAKAFFPSTPEETDDTPTQEREKSSARFFIRSDASNEDGSLIAESGKRFFLTAHGVALGTPSYMSPEQASGEPVDMRTDIFSLGVVFYEAASGRLPFEGKSEHELLEEIRSKDPPPLQLNGDRAHRDFSRIVSTCLSKDSEQRYPSATVLQHDLVRLEKQLEGKTPFREWLSHSSVLAMGAFAAIVLLIALLVRWPPPWEIGRSGANLPPGTRIVLADLDNQTDDGDLEAVQALLEMEIQQSAHLALLSRSAVQQTLKRMVEDETRAVDLEIAREIAWRQGSPVALAASLLSMGSNYILAVRIDQIDDSPAPQATWAKDFRAPDKEGLYDAVDEASKWIRDTLGESQIDVESLDTAARDATTPSWEALDLYVKAEEKRYAGRHEDAIALLKEAIALDPDFAIAWNRLADISYSEEQEKIYEYHHRALDAANRRQLTKREELRMRAVFAHDSHNFADATKYFRTFVLTYPRDFIALTGYGYSLNDLGLEEESIGFFEQAERVRPTTFVSLSNSAVTYLALGRIDEVEDHIRRLRELGLQESAFEVEGSMYFAAQDLPSALDAFQKMADSQIPRWQHRGILHCAEVLAELGRYREAISLLEKHGEIDLQRSRASYAADKLLSSAYLHLLSGNKAACRKACLEAISKERGAIRLLRAGAVLGRAGYLAEAEQVYESVPNLDGIAIYEMARHRIRGEIELSRGAMDEALHEFRQVYAMDAPIHQNEYLARALAASGELDEARSLYQRMSEMPARLLHHEGLVRFPGLLADSAFELARLSYELGDVAAARDALSRYLMMRKNADRELMDLIQAHELALLLGLPDVPGTDE